jgi:hypothetical protein
MSKMAELHAEGQALAGMGDNQGPTDFDMVEQKIDDNYMEAGNWLDGAEVDSPELAEGIATLLNNLRKAGKEAEAQRKAEKLHWDDGAKAVQEKFKPLSDKVKRATDACKKALLPWELKQEAIRDEAARKLRETAENERIEAEKMLQSSSVDNLAEREKAEAQVEAATDADIKARVAANAKTTTTGGGKRLSIRTKRVPVLVDASAAMRHFWPENKGEFKDILVYLAKQQISAGVTDIPGFEIKEERAVV